MAVYKITQTWKKILERQPRQVTLLITFPAIFFYHLYVRLGEGAPVYRDADFSWIPGLVGGMITLSIPPNTPVYAQISAGTAYISCTIIKEMEE